VPRRPLRRTGNPLAKVEKKVLDELATRGETTFWVLVRDDVDLSAAEKTRDWKARGQLVYNGLTTRAETSQAGVRSLLRARSVSFEPFWIVNTVKVKAGQSVLSELAARPEVTEIRADVVYQIPEPLAGTADASPAAVEWNIARVNADKVWSSFNDRGEGITIANIDTGVKFNHPALVNQYRGRKPDGSFDHNYNWFDPSKVCGNPSLVPCDNNGHGSHTMGTMVGDDGNPGPNQIGMAPRARWIAAKGCESFFCSLDALLKSGQWVMAPTDLNGQNPKPELRAHTVNNSWGGGAGSADPFYRETVRKWVAAGMFPAFANGNAGPSCGTAAPPGNYPESYGVGAFDIGNNIAGFSSRGKAIPDSARGQGGSATVGIEDHEGKVAFEYSFDSRALRSNMAVLYRVPPSAYVQGNVTDANDGLAVAGATVRGVDEGGAAITASSNKNGFYRLQLRLGSYTIEGSATNYESDSAVVTLNTEDAFVTQDFSLATGLADLSLNRLEFIVPADQTRARTLTLSNTGTGALPWEIKESGGGKVTTSSTVGLTPNPNYDPNSRTTDTNFPTRAGVQG